MPMAARVSFVSVTNSVVMMQAAGRPRRSSAMLSRTQQEQQDPQSPIAVSTMSHSAAMRAISAGSASFEKLCFT